MLSEIYTSLQALLGYLERQVFASDLEHCFILSTTTMTWFAERGYNEISPDELPSAQQHLYSWKRNPKVNLNLVYFNHRMYRVRCFLSNYTTAALLFVGISKIIHAQAY